ncbi:hypothetical protein LZ31DRAFT_146250 [Colletotrichum somersetense]|nr:hypothetical protein LZ31DRAFT_146250 [Colletotrichum somersetense]
MSSKASKGKNDNPLFFSGRSSISLPPPPPRGVFVDIEHGEPTTYISTKQARVRSPRMTSDASTSTDRPGRTCVPRPALASVTIRKPWSPAARTWARRHHSSAKAHTHTWKDREREREPDHRRHGEMAGLLGETYKAEANTASARLDCKPRCMFLRSPSSPYCPVFGRNPGIQPRVGYVVKPPLGGSVNFSATRQRKRARDHREVCVRPRLSSPRREGEDARNRFVASQPGALSSGGKCEACKLAQ